uniref:EF-hand domain-containing protein n=1 Tax=Timema bartmani TaxID=61472 RepID=A0A7R9EX51_9NEOP|nr:unnamed protein product [Timema bartmani]
MFSALGLDSGKQNGRQTDRIEKTTLSHSDFLGILSKVSRGSVQEKLQWIFGLYDLNGDGLISKSEMLDVVTSIYDMMGRSTDPVVEENSAKEHVEKIFHNRNLSLAGLFQHHYGYVSGMVVDDDDDDDDDGSRKTLDRTEANIDHHQSHTHHFVFSPGH